MKDEKINVYNQDSRLNNKRKLIIYIISVLCFLIAIIILKYYINTDKYFYNSLEDIAENYYPGEYAVYLQEANYAYIIVDSENIAREDFVYKTSEGQYIVFKNLIGERKNRKRYFQYKDIVSENFYSFIHVEMHDNYCIILLERYFVNDERVEVTVYDDFGQLQPVDTYSREYYFKIMELENIEDNYELRVDIAGNSYYIVGTKEFNRAK